MLRRGLPSSVIWPSLQLFCQLEASVKEAFDLASAYWKAVIPVERVNKFMAEPDRAEADVDSAGRGVVEFRDASFSWPSTDGTALAGLSLAFRPGLTIVRGKVGSGKSSLLLAAFNEMELRSGRLVRPDKAMGYAQQLPFLQNKTIRDNIVFNQAFDPARYRQAIHACALAPDLTMLPDNDQNRLEEGGASFSGGQRARMGLARAVYSPCRILLLDDPFAALDHDTASTIVRRFLQGPLARGRTIVVVTHRDDLVLRIADQVVDMDAGRARVLTEEQVQAELRQPYHARPETTHHPDADGAHGSGGGDGDGDGEVPGLDEAPEEAAETGSVSLSVYLGYVKAGSRLLWLLLAALYGGARWCDIARARLLEVWADGTAPQRSRAARGYWGLPSPGEHPRAWLGVLGGLSGGQVVLHLGAQLTLAAISVEAAQAIFYAAVNRVGRATFRYHDTTPTAQLKNRLIADMGMIDGGILAPLQGFVFHLISLALGAAAVTAQSPLLLGILGAVTGALVGVFRVYVPVSRCLRRWCWPWCGRARRPAPWASC